jgi:hypothetical protein
MQTAVISNNGCKPHITHALFLLLPEKLFSIRERLSRCMTTVAAILSGAGVGELLESFHSMKLRFSHHPDQCSRAVA